MVLPWSFVLFLMASYFLVFSGDTATYYTIYIVQRIFFVTSNIMFWLVANDLVDMEQAKRLFAPVIAAGIAGKLTGNLLTAGVVALFPAEAVLLFACAVFACCIGTIVWLQRLNIPPPVTSPNGNPSKPTQESISFFLPKRSMQLSFVRAFIWLTIVVSIGDTILRYEFNTILDQSIQSEQSLIISFSLFKAGAGILVLLFQIFGASYFLRRLSVAGTLNVQPIATVCGFLLISMVPQLLMVASVASLLSMLHFGFYSSGRKIVINIFPLDERGRFSAFTKQPVYLGKLLGALFLFLVVDRVTFVQLNWLALGIMVTWFFFVPRFDRQFNEAQQVMQGSPE